MIQNALFQILLFQYPAFALLALVCLINHLIERKRSALMSTLWVLLFAASLAASVVLVALGIQRRLFTLNTLFPLTTASWVGIGIVLAGFLLHIVHRLELKHSKYVMAKELEKAEKAKNDAIAQAHEEGRRAGQQEAAEAMWQSAPAEPSPLPDPQAPIELSLDAGEPAPENTENPEY